MTEQMPKEQYEYIKRIQDDMLECTNMTENEAWDFAFRCWQCGYNKINKELEQYRALGLTPELIEAMQGHNIAMINDLAEYQALGTLEELRVAKELNDDICTVESEMCEPGDYRKFLKNLADNIRKKRCEDDI